jgi:hypothetical protein
MKMMMSSIIGKERLSAQATGNFQTPAPLWTEETSYVS